MAKVLVNFSFSCILLAVILTGCAKNHESDTNSTPSTTEVPLVQAGVHSNGNPTEATNIAVGIFDEAHSGIGIDDAVVKVNGMKLNSIGAGGYTLLLTSSPITAGTTVSLTITCGAGNFSVSAVMPESGGSVSVDIPGCNAESFFILDNNM